MLNAGSFVGQTVSYNPRLHILPCVYPSNNSNRVNQNQSRTKVNQPIIINPRQPSALPHLPPSLPNNVPPKKRQRKNIEEFEAMFNKWLLKLPKEGIDVSCFKFDSQKGGVFCILCQRVYSTGICLVKYILVFIFLFFYFFAAFRRLFAVFFGNVEQQLSTNVKKKK